ncbi:MAG: glycoside hydrolase family 3 C-terminal domain-containing protein [Rikenellaceae bacterium]
MNKLIRITASIALFFAATSCCSTPESGIDVYLDPARSLEERVEDALSRMTTEEKVAIIHAQSKFSSAGVPRLGIPEVWCTDGPHGIRPEVLWDEWDQAGWSSDSCTAYPALTALAATWSRDMSALYGKSIGEEARYREKDVLLGPGVNIYRSPLNGRNFEYMGEDPYLAAQMVVPYIREVQKNGVAACVKHYALNNQETDRDFIDVKVDDRALYEIYLPAFKAAVQEGDAWAIMGSYNQYKGEQACHNQYLLNDILKRDWGFDGVVVSDWGGVHDTKQAIYNGLDMEFGSWTNGLNWGRSSAYDSYYLAQPYLEMIRSGEVGTVELDDKARRVLRLIFRTAMNSDKPYGSLCSDEHTAAARKIAGEGIVLLKNEGSVLPIDLSAKPTILVVGENALKMMTVGGGSSSLKARREVSPYDGLCEVVGNRAIISYQRGYVGDVSGEYNGVTSGQDLSEKRSEARLIADAVDAAKAADYVVFVGGLNKSHFQDCEGADRQSYGLPYAQDKLIEALAEANDNLVVTMISGNAVAMPWVDKAPAILQAWFLGSEAGNALADILVGDVNPSGKLPFTFPVSLADNSAHSVGEFPGNGKSVEYTESIFVGYRHADRANIAPLFAFGHGLSYTKFEYGDLHLSRATMGKNDVIEASITITNNGDMAGAEVVQFYIADKESRLVRPVRELKGFEKLHLEAGESKQAKFTITADALKYYDDTLGDWIAESGEFTLSAGASSQDLRSSMPFFLK